MHCTHAPHTTYAKKRRENIAQKKKMHATRLLMGTFFQTIEHRTIMYGNFLCGQAIRKVCCGLIDRFGNPHNRAHPMIIAKRTRIRFAICQGNCHRVHASPLCLSIWPTCASIIFYCGWLLACLRTANTPTQRQLRNIEWQMCGWPLSARTDSPLFGTSLAAVYATIAVCMMYTCVCGGSCGCLP